MTLWGWRFWRLAGGAGDGTVLVDASAVGQDVVAGGAQAMKLILNGIDFTLNIERGVGPSHGADKMRGPRLVVTMVDRDNTLVASTLDAAEAQTLATAMQAMVNRLRDGGE